MTVCLAARSLFASNMAKAKTCRSYANAYKSFIRAPFARMCENISIIPIVCHWHRSSMPQTRNKFFIRRLVTFCVARTSIVYLLPSVSSPQWLCARFWLLQHTLWCSHWSISRNVWSGCWRTRNRNASMWMTLLMKTSGTWTIMKSYHLRMTKTFLMQKR